MADFLPPYMNKHTNKLKREVVKAERKELKAKKDYEFAVEYTKLCKEQLEKAKAEEKNGNK